MAECKWICGNYYKVERTGFGDYKIVPPDGYISSRQNCDCSTAFALDDGSCSCAPGDISNPIAIKEVVR